MNPKSGTAGSPVAPTDPENPEEAAVADPGKAAKLRQQKDGSKPEKAHKPNEDKKSWIEIEMVDEEDQPVPGEKYKITLPDGSVAKGTLDEKGFARVEGIDPGTCQITFPNLDKDAWEPA